MKRVLLIGASLLISTCASAQAVQTTVCDILAHPSAFNGKIVQVRGTVIAGFDEFVVKDQPCGREVDAIWLDYPEGAKAKAGPAAMLILRRVADGEKSTPATSPEITLNRNEDFKRFDHALDAQAEKKPCLACPRYSVTATLTGRLDGVETTVLSRQGKLFTTVRGFGNMNRYPARLVLQSVANVTEKEIDYSRPAPVSGSDVSLELTAEELPRAVAAYGGQGEENGVEVRFGVANGSAKETAEKEKRTSPDGLLVDVVLDTDRLKGPALGEAMAHMGTHIADLRETTGRRTVLELEAHAWAASILATIQSKEKTLMLPGGYVLWNSDWTDAERQRLLRPALGSFLADWSALER